MKADAAGETDTPFETAREHAREVFRRPSHGRPRWNTSTNPRPGGSARGRVSEEEDGQAKKWKTPFERALERVRTPRAKASPPSSSESSLQRRRCSWSKTLSDSDESDGGQRLPSSNEYSAHGTRGSELGHIISAVTATDLEVCTHASTNACTLAHAHTHSHAEAHRQSHCEVTPGNMKTSCSREHEARRLCEPVAMGDTACEPLQLGLQAVLDVLEARALSPRRFPH
jgi:hypothetical protein